MFANVHAYISIDALNFFILIIVTAEALSHNIFKVVEVYMEKPVLFLRGEGSSDNVGSKKKAPRELAEQSYKFIYIIFQWPKRKK